eukprot:NODE_12098_length_1246_cov_5.490617.p1 GENE.NODE_12098_length_1246_cov_5.490617~~NODE_12098_length_1246_cov_5.490617.p1  ORF type:complete len:333 (+),score=100.52 NODE_12098_length_1246_cov_5.490617:108-1001(+)
MAQRAEKRRHTWTGAFAFHVVAEDPTVLPPRMRSVAELPVPGGRAVTLLAFEGGQFMWPGVEVGFVRNITLTGGGMPSLPITLLTRALSPVVIEVSSFLSPSECQNIISIATPHIRVSSVALKDKDVGKADSTWRTSSNCFLGASETGLQALDERVGALIRTNKDQHELLQVLRYNEGDRYVSHNDAFHIKDYGTHEQVVHLTENGLFNRFVTVFFYLTTVELGGHTIFPRADGAREKSFDDCSSGLPVYPEEGRIVMFYSLLPSGAIDDNALHGGCPPEAGTKWAANKWVWNKPYG